MLLMVVLLMTMPLSFPQLPPFLASRAKTFGFSIAQIVHNSGTLVNVISSHIIALSTSVVLSSLHCCHCQWHCCRQHWSSVLPLSSSSLTKPINTSVIIPVFLNLVISCLLISLPHIFISYQILLGLVLPHFPPPAPPYYTSTT